MQSKRISETIYSEWESLQEIIVGSAYSSSFLKNFTDNEFVEGKNKQRKGV